MQAQTAGHSQLFQKCPVELLSGAGGSDLSALESQFIELASGNKALQDSHAELKAMQGYRSVTLIFENSSMLVGYLRKFAQRSKLIGKQYDQRFVTLNFKTNVMEIKHNQRTRDPKKTRVIMFSQILTVQSDDCLGPEGGEYSYKFCLKTKERIY